MKDDTNSRQAAVSRISDLLILELKGRRLPTWDEVNEAINELPSAQTEQQWIPVIERLPERNKEVLITAWKDIVLIAWIDDDDMWSCDDFFFDDKTEVSAWMPLPELYREETEYEET